MGIKGSEVTKRLLSRRACYSFNRGIKPQASITELWPNLPISCFWQALSWPGQFHPWRESSTSSWLGVVNSETQGTFYSDLPFSEISRLWTRAWNSSCGIWGILLRTLIPLFLRRDYYLGSQRCKKIEVHCLQRTENKQLFQQGKCYKTEISKLLAMDCYLLSD